MNRKNEWQEVLDAELQRWSTMTYEQLICKLPDIHTYEVEFRSKIYQVEVEILQNTERYLQIMVAVDDGSLPASLAPLIGIFIREKPTSAP